MTTKEKLVAVAAALLDENGEQAVTLRAVGHAAGVSHNAPYKHFENRDALLTAVAAADFTALGEALAKIRQSSVKAASKLNRALGLFIDFSEEHPARYQLLVNDPRIAGLEGDFKMTALRTFGEFAGIVQECQADEQLPVLPHATMTSLIFATLHGLISLSASGRMHPEKGLDGVRPSMKLFIKLLSQQGGEG